MKKRLGCSFLLRATWDVWMVVVCVSGQPWVHVYISLCVLCLECKPVHIFSESMCKCMCMFVWICICHTSITLMGSHSPQISEKVHRPLYPNPNDFCPGTMSSITGPWRNTKVWAAWIRKELFPALPPADFQWNGDGSLDPDLTGERWMSPRLRLWDPLTSFPSVPSLNDPQAISVDRELSVTDRCLELPC